jgi:predicted hydrocarbon binding protein
MTNQYYFPNIWGRNFLTAAEDIIGKNGLNALLNLARLQEYIDNYPPEDIKKAFPFEHVAGLQQALYDMYGSRGARVFATRGGEETLYYTLKKFDLVRKAASAAVRVGTPEIRQRVGLLFFTKFINTVSDQVVQIKESNSYWYWIIERCPYCWGRTSNEPVCHLGLGILRAAVNWATGGKQYRIAETKCIAMGDQGCVYVIDKEPMN